MRTEEENLDAACRKLKPAPKEGEPVDVGKALADLHQQPYKDLCYALARHIRNPDGLDYAQWGIEAMSLLYKLRDMDPEAYTQKVKI